MRASRGRPGSHTCAAAGKRAGSKAVSADGQARDRAHFFHPSPAASERGSKLERALKRWRPATATVADSLFSLARNSLNLSCRKKHTTHLHRRHTTARDDGCACGVGDVSRRQFHGGPVRPSSVLTHHVCASCPRAAAAAAQAGRRAGKQAWPRLMSASASELSTPPCDVCASV